MFNLQPHKGAGIALTNHSVLQLCLAVDQDLTLYGTRGPVSYTHLTLPTKA